MITHRSFKKAAERRGYQVEQQVFDCGDTVRVHDGHILIVAITRECGANETASEAAAAWMLGNGLLVVQDFDERIGAA